MIFESILFLQSQEDTLVETPEVPDFFVDLNLDQVFEAVTAGKQDYNLKQFYFTPLQDAAAIRYRQDVARDLEDKSLLQNINTFAEKMSKMRRYLNLSNRLEYLYHKEGWFLEAVLLYCEAVNCLQADLAASPISSVGLTAFQAYLKHYVQSEAYTNLLEETQKQKSDLATVQYCQIIKGGRVRVRRYESEIDYSTDVEATFVKFKQGAVKDYRIKLTTHPGLNHVEAQILNLVGKLYPEIFNALLQYYARNQDFLDPTIARFDREVQFFVAYLEHIAILKRQGLKFCYPQIATDEKQIFNLEGFDIALAYKLLSSDSPTVVNDFFLKGSERIFVVSGPNQGGKTTFARTFGQLHYLACLGLPVPGREARLFLFDHIFTHFEKEENIRNLRGKLQDDLVRVHAILQQSTPASIVILNEIFTSTTLQDAVFLGRKVMERIIELDLLCVCVSFIDELSAMSDKTVSMVSTVVPDNPAERTFKVIRKPADGLSFALSIAEKHRLTYKSIIERIKP